MTTLLRVIIDDNFFDNTGRCKEDFTPEQWDVLCLARRMYVQGANKRLWYRALRDLCGYRSGGNKKIGHMERLIDEWLRQHPSWQGRYTSEYEVYWILKGED